MVVVVVVVMMVVVMTAVMMQAAGVAIMFADYCTLTCRRSSTIR